MIQAQPRRLPVDLVVRRSFQFAWESRAVLARPYAIYVAVTILADLIFGRAAGPDDQAGLFALTAAEQMLAVAFAVGVHRYVLLAEIQPGFRFFRWDRHFVQYVLVAMLILVLIMMAVVLVLGLSGGDGAGGMGGATALIGLMVMFGAGLVLSRLALALPLAAIGDRLPNRAIWHASEGNGLRLLATILLTLAPFLIVEAGLFRLAPSPGSAVEALVTIALGLISPLQMIVVTIMLSLSYDVLVRGGGPAASR
jgi:hypothetical protein